MESPIIPKPSVIINMFFLIAFPLVLLFSVAPAFEPQGRHAVAAVTGILLREPAQELIQSIFGPQKTVRDVDKKIDKEPPKTDLIKLWRIPWDLDTIPYKINNDSVNIATALKSHIKIFRHSATTSPQKKESFKWMIHLITALHQPLNVSRFNGKWADSITVKYKGEDGNLYDFWQSNILHYHFKNDIILSREISYMLRPESDSSLFSGGIQDWLAETQLLAEKCYIIQKDTLKPDDLHVLPPAYTGTALHLIKKQLKKASLRLAKIINQAAEKGPAFLPFKYIWDRKTDTYYRTDCMGAAIIKAANLWQSDIPPIGRTLHPTCRF